MSETKTRKRTSAMPSATDYLDSLIPAQTGEREIESLKLIERSRIEIRPQARRSFPEAEMRELAASIRSAQEDGQGIMATGIFVPLLVVAAEDGYALVAGERRFRASEPSSEPSSGWRGVPELPCLLMRADPRGVAVAQMIENLQRQGLPPLEEAAGIRSLMKEQKLSIRDVARTLGKDKGYLENRLRLLKMGDDIQAMVSSREDTLKHAYYIDQVRDAGLRKQLIRAVLEDRASVSQVRGKIGPQPKERSAPASPVTQVLGNRAEDSQEPHGLGEGSLNPVEQYIRPGIVLIEQGLARLSEPTYIQEHDRELDALDAEGSDELHSLLESLRTSAQRLAALLS